MSEKPRVKIVKKPLDTDLTASELKALKRKLAPSEVDIGFSGGKMLKDVIDEQYAKLEDADQWHITADEDTPDAVQAKKMNGYQQIKNGTQPVRYKKLLLWKISKEAYEKYLARIAYASKEQVDESIKGPKDAESAGVHLISE